MLAFSAAIDAIFGDPNMAADAIYRPCGGGAGTPCRVIRAMPDQVNDFGSASIVSDSMRLDVRVSEIAAPQNGDTITVDAEVFVIHGDPRRDRLRLVWQIDVLPQEDAHA